MKTLPFFVALVWTATILGCSDKTPPQKAPEVGAGKGGLNFSPSYEAALQSGKARNVLAMIEFSAVW